MKSVRFTLIGTALAVVLSVPASAAHGKVGLWEVTVQTGGMAAMPDMSKMPPEVQAQMRAHGVRMGGSGMKSKFCMTPADVAADKPMYKQTSNCKAQNVKFTGNTYSADVVCTGGMNAKGHIQITYTSPEHYTGVQTTDVFQDGRTMHTTMNMDARWISPNCGSVK